MGTNSRKTYNHNRNERKNYVDRFLSFFPVILLFFLHIIILVLAVFNFGDAGDHTNKLAELQLILRDFPLGCTNQWVKNFCALPKYLVYYITALPILLFTTSAALTYILHYALWLLALFLFTRALFPRKYPPVFATLLAYPLLITAQLVTGKMPIVIGTMLIALGFARFVYDPTDKRWVLFTTIGTLFHPTNVVGLLPFVIYGICAKNGARKHVFPLILSILLIATVFHLTILTYGPNKYVSTRARGTLDGLADLAKQIAYSVLLVALVWYFARKSNVQILCPTYVGATLYVLYIVISYLNPVLPFFTFDVRGLLFAPILAALAAGLDRKQVRKFLTIILVVTLAKTGAAMYIKPFDPSHVTACLRAHLSEFPDQQLIVTCKNGEYSTVLANALTYVSQKVHVPAGVWEMLSAEEHNMLDNICTTNVPPNNNCVFSANTCTLACG